MSNTPMQEPPAQAASSGSGQTLPSRLLQPTSDPSAPKRVCFYKSGDNKFSGHRMVINARTFKTFDGLLDALSKKVPLPFGVRTITTPRGIHLVKNLDDLQDGGSYVCSDQRRVKPLNLSEVNRRQVPWNTTRPFSAGRQRRQGLQFGRRNEISNRPAKITERVAVRTPKRLVVIKNRDPTVKRTIVLQRRTAPTFDALLDYLSQILQFPVLKLYTTDGRRVDGLASLILCSGVIVAAGTEPFRLATSSSHRTAQMVQGMYMDAVEPSMLQPQAQNNKSYSSGRGSRNFSLSSEQYIVNQINKSRNGSMNNHSDHHNGSPAAEVNPRHAAFEPYGTSLGDDGHRPCIVPQDDDIEKSFRVNQDGSMTVEMRVRLTIKEEELLHWTTTLSRSSLCKRTVCASISESGNSSPTSNDAKDSKDSSTLKDDDAKEENSSPVNGNGVSFHDDRAYEGYGSKAKSGFKRAPTPGPRHVKKKASVESVKMVTEAGVQESTTGHYSYMERTANGETTEGYCVVRHSSSSSNRPIPKPRKTASAGVSNKASHSSMRSSGVAEVLQIQNNGMEVTETVMHIYESQGGYDNYFANEEYSLDGVHDSPTVLDSKPSFDSGPGSSSNDCDIDFSWQPPSADSLQRQKEEMLSLSSEPVSPAQQIANSMSLVSENEGQTARNSTQMQQREAAGVKGNGHAGERKRKEIKPARKHKSSPLVSSLDKKQQGSTVSLSKHSKRSSTDKVSSNASVGKKSLSSSESAKSGQKSKVLEKAQAKTSVTGEKKEPALSVKTPPKKQNVNKASAKENGHNVNTPTGRPQMKKNVSDVFQPKKSLLPAKKTGRKPKSMTETRTSSPKKSLELSESVSMPAVNPSPSEIHQYVENWLEDVSPDPVPYMEEAIADEPKPQTKVIFKIGCDSESDERTETQTSPEDHQSLSGDALRKSASCLSVPLSHEASTVPHGEQKARGLCASMPSVRVEPAQQEAMLRSHRSAEAIGTAGDGPTSSNILSPRARIRPVLRQLCSSIQCIRMVPDANAPTSLEKSSSLPDFSSHVASVFGSSCKAFVSFLSVMTLRDTLKSHVPDEGPKNSSSEAMLMMQSLQKISAIDDQEEQRASLTDLQSRASSQLRERWRDFQILRERLQSDPLSPKLSETEFALDVSSEGGDAFDDHIDELMEEVNMPADLRAEISSTIHQAKGFYPVEESTFVENEKYHSDSEEDVEQFVKECDTDANRSPDPYTACIVGNITEAEQNNDQGSSYPEEIHEMYYKHTKIEETGLHEKLSEASQTDRHDPCENQAKVKEEEDPVEDLEEDVDVKETDDGEEEEEETLMGDDDGKGEWGAETGSEEEPVQKDEEGTDGEMTVDEEGKREGRQMRKGMAEEGLTDGSVAETDDRECDEETEEDEKEADMAGRGEEGSVGGWQEQDGGDEEEVLDVIEETDEEAESINEGMEEDAEEDDAEGTIDERDEEVGSITEGVEEDVEEGDDKEEVVSEGEEEEAVECEQGDEDEEEGEEEDGGVALLETAEQTLITDEEDGKGDSDRDVEAIGQSDEAEGSDEELEKAEESAGGESAEGESAEGESAEGESAEGGLEETETEENTHLGQKFAEVEREDDDDDDDARASNEELEEEYAGEGAGSTAESATKYSSEGDRREGSDSFRDSETDEGGDHRVGQRSSSSLPHPVEISQELLDFVNAALQSSSLIFTFNDQGNIQLAPESAGATRATGISKKDNAYGLKCLPSPCTSDLSDYRPETSESGGYKSQDSVDIISGSSGEASGRPFPLCRYSVHRTKRASGAKSKLSVASNSGALKSGGSFSSRDSGAKASREDLSYFSAASSLKGDSDPAAEAPHRVSGFPSEHDAKDGVLIDRGRWLLKENHLIRKSPPVSQGMYSNLDSTSIDTGQENTSVDSPPHHLTQRGLLAAISSSELEEMAKPRAPKCTYYNMPHGSDSDPFLDDVSVTSGRNDAGGAKGRGFRVSPTVDTSRTWANKNGSLSSFASVEFKMPDRKVHPEGEPSAVSRPSRTSSGGGSALQAQDSLDTLHVRCGQYCPIL